MFWILLKEASEDEGEPCTCAASRGTGTREDENGVAPWEKGTFGLFVVFKTEPFPLKDATKDPAKKRLAWKSLVVIDKTSAAAPVRPPKGGADHDDAFVSQTATAEAGEEKWPPARSLLRSESQ
jgi:hypothetical protein